MSKLAKKSITAPKAHTSDVRPAPQAHNNSKNNKKTNPGSKQSQVIAMLRSPAGASIATIMKATGWQQHSVRGFLAGVVRNRLKMKLDSKKVDGTRVYSIAAGQSSKSTPRQSKTRPR